MNIILYSLCMFMSVGSVYLLTTSSFIIVTEHIHTSHNMLLKPDIQLPNVSFGSNITYLDEIINQTNSIIDNTQR